MQRRTIDFRELLERVLPLDQLPALERLQVQRALDGNAAAAIEQAALHALERLAGDGVLRRLPAADASPGMVRRYQPPGGMAIITVELPQPVERDGVLAWPRASLPVGAATGIEQVRRLVRLDDPAFLDHLLSRDTRTAQLQQLDLAGRELLRAQSVCFHAAEPAGDPNAASGVLDPVLIAQAIASPAQLLFVPDVARNPRIAAEALRLGVGSLVVCAVPSGSGPPHGAIEVRAALVGYTPDDLARVALLADAFGAVLDRAVRIERLAFVDRGTGSFNRAYFEVEAQNEIARATRDGASLALCIVDVDDFKTFNSAFGYEAGNQVLLHVAQALKRGVRPFDTVARWGGEEFAVLLTAPVQAEDVHAICERLRIAIQRLPLDLERLDRTREAARVTVSIGVALYPEHGETVADLWRAANQALLVAKRTGKNRIVSFHATGRG
jgi:diguanylate cyclase (GGDEF)-like protein